MAMLQTIQDALGAENTLREGRGRGVVIVGGGRYLPSAYLAIRHLRQRGCKLPIQLWHIGPSEIGAFWNDLVASEGVETIDALEITGASDFQRLGGWECKTHAIFSCPFAQVLLLDADNLPLVNPEFLFESEPFARHGQIFWPDFYYQPDHQYAIRPRAWRDLRLTSRAGSEIDSGQLLIDRYRCWRQLQVCRALNTHSDECFGHWTWGDKDTFTLAWLFAGGDYYGVPLRPRFVEADRGSVFWQHWTDGSRLFQHQRKWLDRPERMQCQLLQGELLTKQSLSYLREFWGAARGTEFERQFCAPPQTAQAKAVALSVSSGKSAAEHRKLGMAAYERDELAEAIEHLERAVALAPSDASYRVDLAALKSKANRPADALPHLLQALRLRGTMPEIHNNLGVVLEQLERFDEAASACRNAIRLRPNYVEAHHNLGKALRKAGDPAGSLDAYREAARLRPDAIAAYDGLVSAAEDLRDVELLCDSLRKLVALQPTSATVRSSLLYTLHYHPDMGPEHLYWEHREWDRLFGRGNDTSPPFTNDRDTSRRIRVGYVSPDFREHTVTKFIGAALKHYDRDRFEVFSYSNLDEGDWLTERIRGQVEHWRDIVGLSDQQAERIIRDDRIDILVDLRGHASGNRMTLFARKPAPVQLNMVGYFDTTGLSAMDYRVTDAQQDPPGQSERHHSEQLMRLPHTCWCYTAAQDAPDVAPPPLERNGYVRFGSLNKIVKVSGACARMWAKVLQAVPASRLLLVVVSERAGEAVRQRLAAIGLPPERLDFVVKAQSHREYLERFGQIDIMLDTFPFNGITTSCDGLWMGAPLVSLGGNTTVSRAGQSILNAIGLSDLAVKTIEGFVAAATALAQDHCRLRELRVGMRKRMLGSALMDHVGFTRALEAEYEQIWRNWKDRHAEVGQ